MNKKLIEALDDLEESKGVSKEVIIDALEKALEKSYEKNFNDATNVDVIVDRENGDIQVYALREVVDDVEDRVTEVGLEEAKTILPSAELGDTIRVEVKPKNFGRVAAQTARNIVLQQLRDAERESIYNEYIDRMHEMITGTVQRVDYSNVYINLGMTEGVIPKNEQIPGEQLEAGERVKLYVADVRNSTKGAQVILSRSHYNLVVRLFEQEVPEIAEGVVEIYSVAREAGSRTKISVFTNDPFVDSIGACVGYKGGRVNLIVDELNGEKMDIVIYDKDPGVFISNALSPSKVNQVIVNHADHEAIIIVPDDQLSLAIGKEGQNVRLAAKLTGWKIDIKGQSQYDEDPDSFDAMAVSEEEAKSLKQDGEDLEIQDQIQDEEEKEESDLIQDKDTQVESEDESEEENTDSLTDEDSTDDTKEKNTDDESDDLLEIEE